MLAGPQPRESQIRTLASTALWSCCRERDCVKYRDVVMSAVVRGMPRIPPSSYHLENSVPVCLSVDPSDKTSMSFRDGSDTTSSLALVQELKAAHPSITILLPPSSSSSPEADRDGTFAAFQKCYISEPDRQPIAIARPRCEAEVALLVTSCAQLGLPFVVRAGGHDLAARSQVNGALVLDLREICHVSIDEENEKDSGGQRTARLGGGCLSSGVLAGLEPWGLVTPTGTISSVGYVGWAFTGGYGPLSSLFGPGVDQIVGARLVTGSGEVVVAGERVLRGLRGAAGALGVVVEVTIKVYPLKQVSLISLVLNVHHDHSRGVFGDMC